MLTVDSIKHIFFDAESKKPQILENDQLSRELDRIAKTLEMHFVKLEKIGNYELDNVQVTVGAHGDILVIGVNGGITLTYSKIETDN
jgi:hypothetical protein